MAKDDGKQGKSKAKKAGRWVIWEVMAAFVVTPLVRLVVGAFLLIVSGIKGLLTP